MSFIMLMHANVAAHQMDLTLMKETTRNLLILKNLTFLKYNILYKQSINFCIFYFY